MFLNKQVSVQKLKTTDPGHDAANSRLAAAHETGQRDVLNVSFRIHAANLQQSDFGCPTFHPKLDPPTPPPYAVGT
jgi:hypothetical protein